MAPMSGPSSKDEREITGRSAKRAGDRKIATAIEWEVVGDEGAYSARFAVPGKAMDYSRRPDGKIKSFATYEAAEREAMVAALTTFNQPRSRVGRNGSRVAGDVRPARLHHSVAEAYASAAGLTKADVSFLLDKRLNRIMSWFNGAEDIPSEVGLILSIMAKFRDTVEFAFEYVNDRLDETEGA